MSTLASAVLLFQCSAQCVTCLGVIDLLSYLLYNILQSSAGLSQGHTTCMYVSPENARAKLGSLLCGVLIFSDIATGDTASNDQLVQTHAQNPINPIPRHAPFEPS